MQRRNLGRLTLGTSVYIAEWMIGKHGPRHQGAHGYPTSHGIVKRVTPNGGVLVEANGFDRWVPYHAIRCDTPGGEPLPLSQQPA